MVKTCTDMVVTLNLVESRLWKKDAGYREEVKQLAIVIADETFEIRDTYGVLLFRQAIVH